MEHLPQMQTQTIVEPLESNSTGTTIPAFSRSNSINEAILTRRRHGSFGGTEDALLQNVVTFCDLSPYTPHKILLHFLEHIFDNVFPKLTENIQRRIILELWKLFPHEVILYLKPSLDRWSKRGVCEACKMAQESCSAFSSEALHTIVNSKTEPFLTDTAVHFIDHYYHGVAHVSRAANRIHETPSVPSPGNRWNYQSCLLNRVPIQSFNYEVDTTIHRFSTLNLNKRLIISIVLCMSITGACGAFVICYQNVKGEATADRLGTEPPYISTSPMPDHSVMPKNLPLKLPEEPIHQGIYFLNVNSYDDYMTSLFKLMHDREVHLVLSLEKDENWPNEFSTGNTHMIKQLEIIVGSSIHKIFEVLKGMLNTEKITITIGNNSLCKKYNQYNTIDRKHIILTNVRHLVLENITECPHFYQAISETVILNQMHTFQIFNGIFTNQNVNYVKKLLINSNDSLKSLEFPGCKWYALLFDKTFSTFSSVEVLKIDFRGDERIIHLHKNICDAFPNIKRFSSLGGFIEWDHFINLSQCKSLSYIKIGLQTRDENGSINLLPMQTYFHELQSFDLSLNFVWFDKMSGCKIIGLEDVERFLVYFKVRSNCHLDKSFD